MEDLQAKTAVVTGGGSGIGAGIVRACAATGMNVVISDIDERRADTLADELNATSGGARAIAVKTDVASLASVTELAERAEEAFGAVHLVCNNAGVWIGRNMLDAEIHDWNWLIDVNLYGVVHGVSVFLPRLVAQGEGHIVNTASMGGLIAGPPEGLYCTTKFAVVGMSEALAYEAAEHGVGVSVLCPGLVKTDLITQSDKLRPAGVPATAAGLHVPDVDAGIEPDEVGRRVLDAVRDNELYIVTHDDYRDFVKMRHDSIIDAMDRHAARYG